MTYPQRILLKGNYGPQDIETAIKEDSKISYPPDLEGEVEAWWQLQLKDAREKGYDLWDSPCYALLECQDTGQKVNLKLGIVDYRTVRGTIPLIDKGELAEEYSSRQMYSSLIIKTSDDLYVFGTGSSQYYVGELKFVGGVYSQAEHQIMNGQSLFDAALSEMEEEINVGRECVKDIVLKAIYATPRGLRDLCFAANLSIDSQEVAERFATRSDKELAKLLILKKEEAIKAVQGLKDRRSEKAELI